MMYDYNDDSIWTELEYSLRVRPTPECECDKWYHALDLRDVHVLIDKYNAHPVVSKVFTIRQPCFLCRSEDRMPWSSFAVDGFSFEELFGDLPHPGTLNLYELHLEYPYYLMSRKS